MVEKRVRVADPKLVSLITKRYSSVAMNETEKAIDHIQNWLLNSKMNVGSLDDILYLTARTIYRLFEFKEVAIGLRSEEDDMFRYVTLLGFTKDAERALRNLAYSFEEMVSYERYPGIRLNSLTDYCLAEDHIHEEREEGSYNRPFVIGKTKRQDIDDFIDGDYIDIAFYDSRVQLLGWIELSNTRNGKMPARESLRWLDLMATILALIVERDRNSEKLMRDTFRYSLE